MKSSRGKAPDPLADPDVPAGMSLALLQELHLLTRDGQLNQDARRKLKQIRHFVGLLRPALDDVYQRHPEPAIVDCGAGKSYLGFLLYELVVGPRGRGQLCAVEVRAELQAAAAERARAFGHARFRFTTGAIEEAASGSRTAAPRSGEAAAPAPPTAAAPPPPAAATDGALPERLHIVAALHACDTATDDAIALGLRHQADYIAVVPCCQAEVARQLKDGPPPAAAAADAAAADTAVPAERWLASLFHHPLHRRELGSHLTNVVRTLALQARGYQVTVTELVGWEHSAKNELILARRVARYDQRAAAELRELCSRFHIAPQLVRQLAAL